MNIKMCFNWRVIAGLAAVVLVVYAAAPDLIGAALPLVVLAACPLSMIVMMRAMSGGDRRENEGADAPGDNPGRDAELARLRVEVAELRAEHAGHRAKNG